MTCLSDSATWDSGHFYTTSSLNSATEAVFVGFGGKHTVKWLATRQSFKNGSLLKAPVNTLSEHRVEIKADWEQCPKAMSNPCTVSWTLALC